MEERERHRRKGKRAAKGMRIKCDSFGNQPKLLSSRIQPNLSA